MAKPIFVIKCPKDLPSDKATEMTTKMEKKLPDWHVVVALVTTDDVEFQAFNADKLPDVDIIALKKELLAK